MFIGRSQELKIINELLDKNSGSLMVYGKRKMGKTTLLTHALKDSKDKTIYYECIKAPIKDNVDGLVGVLIKEGVIPSMLSFSSPSRSWCR